MTGELVNDHLKVIIDDTRHRHRALFDLLMHGDRQAMGLLQMYVGLAVTCAAGAAASFAPQAWLPPWAGVSLTVAGALLIIGAWLCLRAMRTVEIGMPARDVGFWTWSLEADTAATLAQGYLKNAEAAYGMLKRVNEDVVRHNTWARRLGVLSAAGALAVAALGASRIVG